MSMKLIKKKAPRGGLHRWLSAEEETSVKKFFGDKKVFSSEQQILAAKIITEMREFSVWLHCSCIAGDSSALNSAKLRNESMKLYLSGFGHPHTLSCPMYREFKEDADATGTGTRKTAGSKPLNFRDFLPYEESDATVSASGKRENNNDDRTRRKRRPKLARLLLTLIAEAGINKLSQLYPLPSVRPKEAIEALAGVTHAQEFIRGRRLSEIVNFQPAMSEQGQEKLMLELERTDANWPARKARVFYQIFMSDTVSRDKVEFSWNGGSRVFTPERGVSINGEAQEGARPPYWVILAFKRNAEGQVICSEGYAHALFRRTCPVPVDSQLERQTMESISTAVKWLKAKSDSVTLSLEKPVFDIEVEIEGEKGFVLPDFLLNAEVAGTGTHTVVIETMGYTDDEYCERKSEQHKGMSTLGVLQTDPPRWPLELNKPFVNHLFGVLVNLDGIKKQ